MFRRATALSLVLLLAAAGTAPAQQEQQQSVARQWNELLLEAIRHDFARPTVHARNLFHTSIAMWDAWAAYDPGAATHLHHEKAAADDIAAARAETLSFAAYRVLVARFAASPGAAGSLASFNAKMDELGYQRSFTSTEGTTPAALGNRIAQSVLGFGAADGSNEAGGFKNQFYFPVNQPLLPVFPGNPNIQDPNRWQPLALEYFVDQSGNPLPTGTPAFLSPEWGAVTPFSLTRADRVSRQRGGFTYHLYHDPGPPPQFGGEGDAEYRAGFEQVLEWSGELDPTDGVMIDISPASRGDNSLGANDGDGRELNPRTGQPYPPQIVPAGDYFRVLAEFWADGPASETPPGHWFTIANYVSDHPDVEHRLRGQGEVLDRLEWDVKLYFALGGALHDVAVSAWGVKGWYDYVRPVSAIRYMADLGQRTDPFGPSYDPDGIALAPGRVEVITDASSAPGERHAHLRGVAGSNIGKIAVRAWRGPDYIADPDIDTAGVGWILAGNWWPYQRPSFVTPPFAGYVSGHSTFSRAAATVMAEFTGDEFFPGGVGTFEAPRNEFLVFEEGPSVDLTLQWATYFDASDECSLSRIYGGIHPRADDLPGRRMGSTIGAQAFAKALTYFAATPAVNIRKGRAKPLSQGRGKVSAAGTLITGGAGSQDAFDVEDGLTLMVSCGPGLLELRSFAPQDIQVSKSGKIVCRAPDGSAKATFKPSKKVLGEYTFSLAVKVGTYAVPVTGPLSVQLGSEGALRTGTRTDCVLNSKGTKLTCRAVK